MCHDILNSGVFFLTIQELGRCHIFSRYAVTVYIYFAIAYCKTANGFSQRHFEFSTLFVFYYIKYCLSTLLLVCIKTFKAISRVRCVKIRRFGIPLSSPPRSTLGQRENERERGFRKFRLYPVRDVTHWMRITEYISSLRKFQILVLSRH